MATVSAAKMRMRVLYGTGNAGKYAEASHVFKRADNVARADVVLTQVDFDTTEIQGNHEEISVRKCTEMASASAAMHAGQDFLLVEDVSLELEALNSFPGPYCKAMLEAIGPSGLWDLMSRYDNRRARVTCTVGAMDLVGRHWGEREVQIFSGSIHGVIVAPKGDVQHGKASWNSVFLPDGYDKTFGELQFHEQAEMSHRRIALERFLDVVCESKVALS